MRRKNAITAAIAHLGGRGTGTKKLASLLDLTTARVYQLVTAGVVPHAEQALKLSRETGIPFEDFLIPKKRKPSGDPNGSGRRTRKPPKGRTLTIVPDSDSSAAATEDAHRSIAKLGDRPARVVRPERPSRAWTTSRRALKAA